LTIPEPYKSIVEKNYQTLISKGLSDNSLTEYFNVCFDDTIRHFKAYDCWVCVHCLSEGKLSWGWGDKPNNCPECGQVVYKVATFQLRASITGDAFEWAFYKLLNAYYNLPLVRVSAYTHDFEVGNNVAINCKGSAGEVPNPDGSRVILGRPGMIRSDTYKKAFGDAKNFRKQRPNWRFYIVTNAMPDNLIGYKNRDIDGIYDVTKLNQLERLIDEIRQNLKGTLI